jgi:putative hydrolase of the HAD superfamily
MASVAAPTFAVGFDFDHTLGLDNGLERLAFYRLAAELGRSVSEQDTSWSAFLSAILARFRAGLVTLDATVEAFVERLAVRKTADAPTRYRAICYDLVDELVTPIAGAREVIAALVARGIPTAILTNGWSPLQNLKIARAIDYTGPILVSDTLGILKPDAAAFGKLVDVLAVPAENIWFVGDNPKTDIAGAQGAGLRGVWFDWEEMSYPSDAPAPDMRIGSLHELLDILPGPNVSAENVAQ